MRIASEECCYLCGSTRIEGSYSEAPELARCQECGLVFTADTESSAARKAYGVDDFATNGHQSYFHHAPQWRFEAQRRLRWLMSVTRPTRLLEVGCAGGFFLEAARGAGISVLGVESSPVAAAHARTLLNQPVEVEAFEAARMQGPFDAVCAFHVLEYVAEPHRFLARARSVLAPGGVLALEVPNIESLEARRLGRDWPAFLPEYHHWHFAPGSLLRLVNEHGFVVASVDTVFDRHYTQLRHRHRREWLASFLHDSRAAHTLRSRHASLGSHLRLLARRA